MKLISLAIYTSSLAALGACTTEAQSQSEWRDAITTNPIADSGCFHAAYPEMTWSPVSCATAPNRAFASISTNANGVPFVVGNGDDYALTVTDLMSKSDGTFPHVSGLVSENDEGSVNTYSLQLNSNFMSGTAACAGISGCLSWTQFVYSASEQAAFMQDWLINYGDTCPTTGSWNQYSGSCYENSTAATVPTLPLTSDSDLESFKITGAAVNGGNDTIVFANGTDAYTASQPDSVTNLASAWNASEFNIIGDGGGTEATFNKSATIKVRIGARDTAQVAPTCATNAGTTGETNNRTLGTCVAEVSGTEPFIEFVETP